MFATRSHSEQLRVNAEAHNAFKSFQTRAKEETNWQESHYTHAELVA
jgi:hypothetical protein